ncbi:MAG: polyprenyl diphosphate synthase [Patescibacteria group bacterium]
MSRRPTSVGLIMDGNRRYAKEHGLPTFEGHTKGLQKMKEVVHWAHRAGVKEITLYAFSTENWKRGAEEVSYLMKLFEKAFGDWLCELRDKGFQVRFIGERKLPSQKILSLMDKTEAETKAGTEGTLTIAFSYGGRAEIMHAVNTLLEEGKKEVTEEEFKSKMWSAGLSDPDLIIRTSGEQRLSNFLPWQSVYSELFFTKTYWPDFSEEEFNSILDAYGARERRIGA